MAHAPILPTIHALFVPALHLEKQPEVEWNYRLLAPAEQRMLI